MQRDTEPTLGEIAFEGYRIAKQNKTYDNKPIPPWEAVGDDVRQAWEAAALAVKMRLDFVAMIERNIKKI